MMPSNPLLKTVARAPGGLFSNYEKHPWTLIAPALAFVGAAQTIGFLGGQRAGFAFIASGVAVAGVDRHRGT
jgi:cytochrome d ubiquinol oxidase subunit II